MANPNQICPGLNGTGGERVNRINQFLMKVDREQEGFVGCNNKRGGRISLTLSNRLLGCVCTCSVCCLFPVCAGYLPADIFYFAAA